MSTTTPNDELTQLIGAARWFGGKGRPFRVTDVRRLGWVETGTEARAAIDLVTVTYDDSPDGQDVELYQVPLAFYGEPQDRLNHAFVGWWEEAELGGFVHAYDALHDREAMAGWLRAFDNPPADGPLDFRRLPGYDLDLEAHSTLFSGEQSNSSVAFGEDSLLKVFRKVTPGVNPDIAVHEVLTAAGSEHVAALYGWLEARDAGSADGAPLQLAMLQQFLRTATDGWDSALGSIRNLFAEADLHADEVGGDFAAESARLGESLAEVHKTLAEHFPTRVRTPEEQRASADDMLARLDAAVAVVPELAQYADGLRSTFEAAAEVPGVLIQQVHGDLHLGQTLRTVKGWKIVDFEGEPAKPLTERLLPDSAWRDVAGMLRSFDYAPRVAERLAEGSDDTGTEQRAFRAAEWAGRNCTAFLEAYAGRVLTDDEERLLAAYVADKAVYEAVYEARNRPTWLAIPLSAIVALVS